MLLNDQETTLGTIPSLEAHMTTEIPSEPIKDSPIVTEGYGEPITCYLNFKPYQYLEKACIGGHVHTCIAEYSPGGLSVHGAWKRDTPIKNCSG